MQLSVRQQRLRFSIAPWMFLFISPLLIISLCLTLSSLFSFSPLFLHVCFRLSFSLILQAIYFLFCFCESHSSTTGQCPATHTFESSAAPSGKENIRKTALLLTAKFFQVAFRFSFFPRPGPQSQRCPHRFEGDSDHFFFGFFSSFFLNHEE